MKRAATVVALAGLFWVGLFCDPINFWLTDIRTTLTEAPVMGEWTQ